MGGSGTGTRDVHAAPASETIRRRAYRVIFPILAAVAVTVWMIERIEGFPHVVDRVGIPLLAAAYLVATWLVWRRPAWIRWVEWSTLLASFGFFLAAALNSAIVGNLDTQLPGLNGYLPLAFAVAFLMLGPTAGALASLALYVGFVAVAVWGIASGRLPLAEAMPLFAGTGLLLALLYVVARSVAASARHQARMELEAATDTLTGALNRRGGISALERLRGPFALLVIDLDRFKRVNDRYGHARGDEALQRCASAMERELRPRDLLVRWGGDEFVVIAPDTDADGARALSDRLRATVRGVGGMMDLRLAVSVGRAVRRDGEPWRDVFDRADADMYDVKSSGANWPSADRDG
jgi:diguanylate cyclase (GGDEF)-like protein